MYYRVRKNICTAIQYTAGAEKDLISFGFGAVNFKEIFNAKTKDFENRLMLTKKDGHDLIIPPGSYLAKFEDDFQIYSEEEFKEKFILINELSTDS